MAAEDPIQDLYKLLNSPLFSRQNAECVARVCHDAAKLVYERQKMLRKNQLKPKEVSSALVLAETLHSSAFRFVAEGKLAELFGGCDEATALAYYEKNVMGDVIDQSGRKITIDEDGMKSLYKDPASGFHVVESANYEEVRGKRLPWIRHTLQNSDAIYVVEEMTERWIPAHVSAHVHRHSPIRKRQRADDVLRRNRSRGKKSGSAYDHGI